MHAASQAFAVASKEALSVGERQSSQQHRCAPPGLSPAVPGALTQIQSGKLRTQGKTLVLL